MSKKEKLKFYALKNILTREAHYYVIYGERSNGKTYSVLEYALERYFQTGEQLAIIRRYDTDFKGEQSMRSCYDSLSCNGNNENIVEKLSGGEYNGVQYYASRYYLTKQEGDETVRTKNCVALAFALNTWEHSKSGSFPRVKTILFDEFMTRGRYLVDEFILFQNQISTIVRQRNDIRIFMCANTVNKYGCLYFDEMGLTRIKKMVPGDIDLYTYGNTPLRVAVEFSDSPSKTKPSDVYFAFDNPRLQMITGQGAVWEMDIYPHLPCKYLPKEVLFMFFIVFDNEMLQCEVINKVEGSQMTFLYIHRKTTPLKDEEKDLIYSTDYHPNPNRRRNILRGSLNVEKKISELFRSEKVFYQDNEIGEIMNSYLEWCRVN